ncbi:MULTISPECIES: hypothetical protein [Pseudomonas]|uniref:Uncharacterized protein n=1 Tax=Pseudomonas solani TaxID=2731552 RepID=A0AAU7XWH6_9PSED|nr:MULTISPECIES: hypothetical protein [Pseudomonas]MDU9414649.1 hypothetical protein [Pseudomonas sp. zfem005]WCD82679.1 hypothetical protein PI990_11870 [Pseudomonas sp. TUM22785]
MNSQPAFSRETPEQQAAPVLPTEALRRPEQDVWRLSRSAKPLRTWRLSK